MSNGLAELLSYEKRCPTPVVTVVGHLGDPRILSILNSINFLNNGICRKKKLF